MRHGKVLGKLNRDSSHRKATLRALATSLVLKGRVCTTIARARELKRLGDKLITLGKKSDLNSRRIALGYLYEINKFQVGNVQKRTAVHVLFEDLAKRFASRAGGYTRMLKLGNRPGDNAEMALVEYLPVSESGEASPKATKKRRVVRRSEVASESVAGS